MGPALLAASQASLKGAQDNRGQNRVAGLGREAFEPLVNSSFAVRPASFAAQPASGPPAWLVLTQVEKLNTQEPAVNEAMMAVRPPRHRPTPATDAFMLHFYGAGASLTQDTYMLEHAALGAFDLFVVPSGPASYTAVFNRLVGPRSPA